MIRIQETKNEYLLFIPAAQKERARGIQGRRWDPQRVCWVYPRNTRMYHSLIAEFGDDLTSESSFTSPQTIPGQDRANVQDAPELQQNIVTCPPKTGPGIMLELGRRKGERWRGRDIRRSR